LSCSPSLAVRVIVLLVLRILRELIPSRDKSAGFLSLCCC
jgi:hypothetical protein